MNILRNSNCATCYHDNLPPPRNPSESVNYLQQDIETIFQSSSFKIKLHPAHFINTIQCCCCFFFKPTTMQQSVRRRRILQQGETSSVAHLQSVVARTTNAGRSGGCAVYFPELSQMIARWLTRPLHVRLSCSAYQFFPQEC